MLGPPQPAPPREKQALPRPAPQKLTKPAGRSGAKLTKDNIDLMPTKFGLQGGKEGIAFQLVFCKACDYFGCSKII